MKTQTTADFGAFLLASPFCATGCYFVLSEDDDEILGL